MHVAHRSIRAAAPLTEEWKYFKLWSTLARCVQQVGVLAAFTETLRHDAWPRHRNCMTSWRDGFYPQRPPSLSPTRGSEGSGLREQGFLFFGFLFYFVSLLQLSVGVILELLCGWVTELEGRGRV